MLGELVGPTPPRCRVHLNELAYWPSPAQGRKGGRYNKAEAFLACLKRKQGVGRQ
jgi:hypothetical protein